MRTVRRIGIAIASLLILIALYYGSYLALRGPRPSEVQLIAHRGGRALAPENTLAAFRLAVAAGADWLEFDVQLSRDGVPVVFHDETLERAAGAGRVNERTLAELRALDAGAGEPIPTFAEVLTLARESGVGVLPEAKLPQLNPGLEGAIVEVLEASGPQQRVALQSFDHEALATLHRLDPELPLCPLYGLWELRLPAVLAGSDTICPMAEMVLLNPWMVRQAQRRGQRVFVWFGIVDRPWSQRALRTLGVDGLMVDDPAALARLLGGNP